jgi:glycerophosphoryl diester phosphodiesterase
MPTPLLLGHRGVRRSSSILENTPQAFDSALSHGCNGFEFDVRLSGDSEAVVCHDARVRGMEIAACSSEKLGLPFLRDVLERYRKQAFLDIELKVAGLEPLVVDLLSLFPPALGYVISSFLPDVLEKIHRLRKSATLGLICETSSQFAEWPRLPVQYVIPHFKLATRSVIERLKAEHRNVLVWTINSADDMMRFTRWNVDGIISDDPGKLVATVRKKSFPASEAARR